MTTEAKAILSQLRAVNKRLTRLESALSRGQMPDDAWARMPSRGTRCAVSNWCRDTIVKLANQGKVRTKKVGAARFYATADVRKILENS